MTKYISFGSIMVYLLYPLLLSRMKSPTDPSLAILIAFVICFMGVFMHRANLKRIFAGTESKVSFNVKDKPAYVEPEITMYEEKETKTEETTAAGADKTDGGENT